MKLELKRMMKCVFSMTGIFLLLVLQVQAATIYGTVYSWETLEPLPKTVIVVNTTPEQQIVSEDGSYFINLTPGSYVLRAIYYKDGNLELYAEMNVTVEKEGSYNIDLILFPPLSNFSFEEPEEINFILEEKESVYNFAIPLALISLASMVAIYLILRKRMKKEVTLKSIEQVAEEKTEVTDTSDLPEDLIEVISIIEKEGGRITQKELRKKLSYSDAKMSLMIADLERRGFVEKIKKGRGNIIFLKK